MEHYIGNCDLTLYPAPILNGDTFKCGCSIKHETGRFNSWKYNDGTWFYLKPDKKAKYGHNWTKPSKFPREELPREIVQFS